MAALTVRQQAVLAVIRDSLQRRGYPPSYREIGDAAGLSSISSVAHQVRALERKGFLRRDPNRPRAIALADPATGGDVLRRAQGRAMVRLAARYTTAFRALTAEELAKGDRS